jgi:mono/diheme cytochrome c family protein
MRSRLPLTLTAALVIGLAGTTFAADGTALFKQHCASCHGETGKADTSAAKALKVPPLAGDAKVAAMADADVATRIKTNEKHKSVIKKLTDDDVAAVAAHVKGLAAAK